MQIVNNRKIYEAMNTARKRRGLTWHKFAARAGITPSVIARFVAFFEPERQPNSRETTGGIALETFMLAMNYIGKYDIREFMVDEDDPSEEREPRPVRDSKNARVRSTS